MLLVTFTLSAQRKIKLLNQDWNFTYGYEVKKNVYERIDIPHTWNKIDANSGNPSYYRGLGNYERDILIDSAWKGKRLFLKFYGVNSIANVFVNGKHIGEHRGGYTAFIFELTNFVQYGKINTILVRVNNAPQLDIMPLLGDFNFYGGIYRDVELLITEKAVISPLDYASSGVYLSQKKVTKEKAEVEALVKISNLDNQSGLQLALRVKDGNKTVLERILDVNSNQEEVKIPFTINKPHLWNGVVDPYMYQVEVSLYDSNVVIDEVAQPLGLRYYHVDENNGFFLNGQHLDLQGVCRHQDRALIGNALRKEHHDEDLIIMQEMGANSIRLSHYPNDPYVYDILDEAGFVTWSEIPFVGPGGYRDKGFVDQESFKDNGKQQLIEMIRQQYNHPSICFWGLYNELKTTGDSPIEYVKELHALAHKEDPGRITTAASNSEDNQLHEITDLIAWNRYFGWYRGAPSDIGTWMDELHKEQASFKIGLSEYGAGASAFHHENELKKPKAPDRWHPEKWQSHYHEEYWKAIKDRPYIWGSYIWNMFDFGAAHRSEGEDIGKNDKGLLTFDRKIKKDAFYFYKANWNLEDKFVYITERRFVVREQSKIKVRVYSNCPEVELFINGKTFGKAYGSYGIFEWNNVNLYHGKNTVEVRAKIKNKEYSDQCIWVLQ
ncbi:beta-glucuronidase LacZ4 [Maribacter spongiicola]|uniref:beta-glucuronidase LacZ4 n=1 Tax=Maribacter spongiicola TaxID=1206753 RepID=UPI001AAF3832|nr:glycoside hydrolase family 2 TIM barrel-domain containing protein [Maribacter spongiicola]